MSDDAVRRLQSRVDMLAPRRFSGRVLSVTGPLVRAELSGAAIGELCELRDPSVTAGEKRMAEVVGFEGSAALLSVMGETRGLSVRTEVFPSGAEAMVEVGDFLLGSIIDGTGALLRAADQPPRTTNRFMRPLNGLPSDVLDRRPISAPFSVGVPALDGLLTCGEGQRLGVFGSPGTGKSSLIASIIHNARADVVVTALVGERGREVGEFVARTMPPGTPSNSVLVVATSDRPPLERFRATLVATTIAEHFRDQGQRVLLIVDSITRLARALREVGLAAGEPPVRRGFPPSVFGCLPKVLERAGNGARGTMTAFYTVLVEGNEADDPIAEETRSLLDGHIVLSDEIAASGLFPAIDVLASRSRTMNAVVSASHLAAANKVRGFMSVAKSMELLIRVGEYQPGRDPAVDLAVQKRAAIETFLYRSSPSPQSFEACVAELEALAR